MAARKASVSKSGGVVVVQTPQAPARRRSSSPARRRSGGKRRRRSSVGGGTAGLKSRMLGAAGGGFAVGFIEKQWGAQMPSLPFIGRKGAIALAAYFLAPKSKIFTDIGISAAAISGYELGKLGVISGEDDDEVSGEVLTG